MLLYFHNVHSYFCTHNTHILGRDLVLLKNVFLILLERFLLLVQFNKHLLSSPEKHWSFDTRCPPLVTVCHCQHKCQLQQEF